MIPMVNLKQQYLELKEEIDKGMADVLESCHFVLGPNVQAFEKETADYLGVKHAVGVASGTDALLLALEAAGVSCGDEVITTPFTFIATAEAIAYLGAKPVFIDIDPQTFNIALGAIESAITERTTAIMPVHLFGQPVDLQALQSIADKHGLKIIEDCAQSFGASIKGQQTGSFGVAGGFSFFPSKNLGGFGDGGLVTTQSDEVAEVVKSLRNHGSEVRYHHDRIGYNSRLDEIQAMILRTKLKHIDEYNQNRRRVAHLYSGMMADLPLETPYEDGVGEHVYHQYTLLTEKRDEVMQALQNAQIASAIYYPIPLHQQKVFRDKNGQAAVSLPIAEDVASRCMSLPIFPELSNEKAELIVKTIKSVFR